MVLSTRVRHAIRAKVGTGGHSPVSAADASSHDVPSGAVVRV